MNARQRVPFAKRTFDILSFWIALLILLSRIYFFLWLFADKIWNLEDLFSTMPTGWG